ncbi:hypothetical protein HPP92_013859 [Vanilla planifolia]|uniref:Uncharacterized protein n=1 Tax=Vanilla planifolia TaxID=51239 RepID=A0A835V0D5_VANPL|nr:hypothetical protein HPP92_013859 [Vanilla planifolia]
MLKKNPTNKKESEEMGPSKTVQVETLPFDDQPATAMKWLGQVDSGAPIER